jgi:MFS family permease
MMNEASKKIVNTFLMLSGMFTLSASLIWGINTLFLLRSGLNIFQVFVVNGIYSASMAVFEIPTGVFADTLGRKLSFIFSTLVLTLGTIGYVIVGSMNNNFILFCIMSGVLGLAFTFYSGAVEAWLVDALYATKFDGELEEVFAKGMVVSNVAMLIGTTMGGFLGTLNLNIPYITRGAIQVVVLLLAIFYMHDIGYTPRKLERKYLFKEMKAIASESVRFGLGNPSTRYLMGITFVFSSFMMWGWYAWQPYFLELFGNTNAIWIAGLIAAGVSFSQICGSVFFKNIKKRFRYRSHVLVIAFLVQSIALIGIGLTSSFGLAVFLFLIFAFLLGISGPLRQGYIHSIIPSEHRATIISLESLIGSSGSFIGQIGYGYISHVFTIATGYLIGGFVNFLVFPFIFLLKKQGDKVDRIQDKEQ